MEQWAAIAIGIFILSFCVSGLIEDIIAIYKILKLRTHGAKAKGLIIDIIYDDEETQAGRLVVEYGASNGKKYRIESTTGSIFWKNKKGQEIDIIYNTSKPETAFIEKDLKFRFSIFFIIQLVFFFVGMSFLIYGISMSF